MYSEIFNTLLLAIWKCNRHISESTCPFFFHMLYLFSCSSAPDLDFEEEGNLGLVILLVLFSVVILTTVLSLIFVMW